jgi:hypothetical protein
MSVPHSNNIAGSRPNDRSGARAWLVLCALAFPLVVAVFATFFHGGNFGPWNDDYFFNTLDPSTREVTGWAVTSREPYLEPTGYLNAWRPLLFTLITGLITFTWDQFWIARGVGALLHVTNCILLYRAARGLGAGVRPAAFAACIMLCCAGAHEAWLWPSAYGSVTSALLLQCVIGLMFYFARGYDAQRSRAWVIPVMMIVVVAILCFNEQATGALGALPFAYIAAKGLNESRRTSLVRALAATAAVCVLPPIYVMLVKFTAQPGLGTNPETYVPLSKLWPRYLETVRAFKDAILLREFWYPAFALGWRTITVTNATFWCWAVALGAGCVMSWRAWMYGRACLCNVTTETATVSVHTLQSALTRADTTRWWAVGVFGVLAALGTMLPIAIIVGYPALSRVTYVVILMLLYAALPVFHWADQCVERMVRVGGGGSGTAGHATGEGARAGLARWGARWTTAVSGVILLLFMLAGGVMSVGAAERMRRTVAADERNGMQLMAQVPNPVPGTVFLPLSIRPPVFTIEEIVLLHPWMRPERVGREMDLWRPKVGGFHWMVRSAWEGLWSMKFFVKFIYRRNDLWCLYAAEGLQPVVDADERTITVIWNFGIPYGQLDAAGGPHDIDAVIPLDKIVPITFDARGNLLVASRLEVYRDGVLQRTLEIPQAAGYAPGAGVVGRVDLGRE